LGVVARREAIRLARHDRCAAALVATHSDHRATAADRYLAARDALGQLAGMPVGKRTVLTLTSRSARPVNLPLSLDPPIVGAGGWVAGA